MAKHTRRTHKKKKGSHHRKKKHVGVGVRRHRRRRHMRGGNFWDSISDGIGYVSNIADKVAPLIKLAAI